MPLLGLLRCVGCRSGGLQQRGAVLDCPSCGRVYPVQADVPVMLDDATAERGPLLDPATARDILARLDIPADPFTTLRARRASRARARCGAARLPEDGRILGRPSAPPAPASPGGTQCQWLGEYVPRAMRPGEELLANVRFRNAGATPMQCAGDGRVTVAALWCDLDGAGAGVDEVRTPLPIDLPPGQALTLPIRLIAPPAAGRYTLMLKLVQEGVQWLEPPAGPLLVRVHDAAGFIPPPHWVLDGPGAHEPEAARERGVAAMRRWLAGHPAPRVLEVGGGATPTVGQLPGASINADGDLLALQLGCLVSRDGSAVLPVCADLADLPLPGGYFDAILCFGALHTMADPAATLRGLRALLRPGGFIGLADEPIGQTWPGAASPVLLAKLRQGRNPQGFSLAEFARIFGAARLCATELVVVGPTLAARLEAEGGDA